MMDEINPDKEYLAYRKAKKFKLTENEFYLDMIETWWQNRTLDITRRYAELSIINGGNKDILKQRFGRQRFCTIDPKNGKRKHVWCIDTNAGNVWITAYNDSTIYEVDATYDEEEFQTLWNFLCDLYDVTLIKG